MANLGRRLALLAPAFCQNVYRTTTQVHKIMPRCKLQIQKFYSANKFGTSSAALKRETVTINFVNPEGERISVKSKVGDSLLDVIVDNDVDIDGFGACEGTLACSTCHLVFKKPDYEKLPETPTDEELDMLDLAFGLSETSRLGCQVIVSKDMDGWVIHVPSSVADAREV